MSEELSDKPFSFKPSITACEVHIAEQAWEVHRAMRLVEQQMPELEANALWQYFSRVAYKRFESAFEKIQ